MRGSSREFVAQDSPAKVTVDMEYSKTARKLPKPKLVADTVENNELLAQDTAARNCITFIENNPTLAPALWLHIDANFIKAKRKHHDLDPNAPWNAEYRQIWRLPVYWRGMFLQRSMPSLTMAILEQLESAHGDTVNSLFLAETGLHPNDPLPRPCLDKDVCMRTMLERVKRRGSFLGTVPAHALNGNKYDFINHGLYKLEFEHGKLTNVTHWTSVVGVIPSYLVVSSADFVLVDNFLEFGAHLRHKVDKKRQYLHTFFAEGEGPHKSSIGSKGAELTKLAKEVADQCAQALHDLRGGVDCTDEMLRLGEEQKDNTRKMALEAARKKLKANKVHKEAARELSLT